MPKNVMKMLKPSPNLGRNAFDMSFRSLFSAKMGELLPVYCQETVPNDKFEIRPANLVRALPMVTSPFLRVKQHIDFWFVPYSNIWSRFNEFMMGKDEPNSSAFKARTYLPCFGAHQLFQAIDGASAVQTDICGIPYKQGAYKIANLLGYGSQHRVPANPNGDNGDFLVNPFRIAAYNLIWYREYRQQYYDNGDYMNQWYDDGVLPPAYQARIFNMDNLACDSVANATLNDFRLRAMFQMRYRCWKKDLYTGLMPSTQFGNVSTVAVNLLSGWTDTDAGRWDTSRNVGGSVQAGTPSDPKKLYAVNGTDLESIQHSHLLSSARSQFDILSLRRSEAIQKWREAALRAGNQIEDNFEAHYGSKPKSHLFYHPTFIGSYDAPLNISDVNATAETTAETNGQLGDVAGKGISSLDGKSLKFETNDFGIIMGIFSLVPEAEYNAVGLDRVNSLLEPADFFVPEYENLGLVPVGSEVFDAQYGINEEPFAVGYAPRYWWYKQRMDLVHDTFMNVEFPAQLAGYKGPFAPWASPKYDVCRGFSNVDPDDPASPLGDLSTLYINPTIFDVNFGVTAEENDQFLVDMFYDATAVRSMSVSGMPSYNL